MYLQSRFMVPKPLSTTFNNKNFEYFRISFTGATYRHIQIISKTPHTPEEVILLGI